MIDKLVLVYNSELSKLEKSLLEEAQNEDIYIASAFFSNSEIIKEFLSRGCHIKLIIRLNKGTSPDELEKLIPCLPDNNLEIRFFTDEHFHPKFYIFGDETAFIGSSNLTDNGLNKNQEMNVRIEDKETVSSLQEVFNSYWAQAENLNGEIIRNFKSAVSRYDKKEEETVSKRIKDSIGTVKYSINEFIDLKNQDFMFYCTGDGEHRNYEDYFRYSFISAGQKKKDTGYLHSNAIRRLKEGMYFFAYCKRKKNVGGYVGLGKIVEEAVPIDDFEIDGHKIYELPLIQTNIKENHDNDACEWVAKVKWIKTVSRENAFYFREMFSGARHTVCKIDKKKHEKTVEFLIDNFFY